MAAPWTPDPALAGNDGRVRPEILCAAPDCPGGFASGVAETTMVLGRLAGRIVAPVEPGAACVVVGRSERVERRKRFAVTGLFAADGTFHAIARATWISV